MEAESARGATAARSDELLNDDDDDEKAEAAAAAARSVAAVLRGVVRRRRLRPSPAAAAVAAVAETYSYNYARSPDARSPRRRKRGWQWRVAGVKKTARSNSARDEVRTDWRRCLTRRQRRRQRRRRRRDSVIQRALLERCYNSVRFNLARWSDDDVVSRRAVRQWRSRGPDRPRALGSPDPESPRQSECVSIIAERRQRR